MGGSCVRILHVREAPEGGAPLTNLRLRVGPLPKNLRLEASEALRLAEARVLRVVVARGDSSARILRVWEALGGARFPGLNAPSGSPS